MKLVPLSVTRAIGKKVLQAKKNSPHIFFVGGVIGIGASTFMACRATLKLEEALDEVKGDIEQVKASKPRIDSPNDNYDQESYVKDLGYVYGKATTRLARLYGPSVVVGAASIAALAGSHVQMTRRNAALSAAFASLAQAFDEYRGRVQEEVGEERENDIYHAFCADPKEVEVEGKTILVREKDPNAFSLYARCFDETNPNWEKSNEHNRIFLQMQQQYFNHRLNAYQHVFLNEVYDKLGFERTKAGQVVGWVLNGPNSDGFIDFSMFQDKNASFVNGWERSIWLDFNVDGNVLELF